MSSPGATPRCAPSRQHSRSVTSCALARDVFIPFPGTFQHSFPREVCEHERTKTPPRFICACACDIGFRLAGLFAAVGEMRACVGCMLVIGRDDDLCCRLVRQHLASLARDVVFLPEGQLFPGLLFSWELRDGESSGILESGDGTVRFDQIDGVLARFSGIATSPDDFHTKDGRYLSSEWHALMRGYMQSLSCPVINRPSPELWYRRFLRAPELFSLVSDSPFRLPLTLVATRFADVQAFFDLCGGRIRYSPLTVPS